MKKLLTLYSSKYKKGFSLIEVMIAGAISLVLFSSLTELVFSYTKSSSKDIINLTLKENQRNLVRRLEKEIQEGACAIPSFTAPNGTNYTASADTLILTVPIFNSDGTQRELSSVTCSATSTSDNDVIVIRKDAGSVTDPNDGKLIFSRFTGTGSNRAPILKLVLARGVMDKDPSNATYTIFNYLTQDGATPSPLTDTKMIRLNLWVSEKYGSTLVNDYKELYVTILGKNF